MSLRPFRSAAPVLGLVLAWGGGALLRGQGSFAAEVQERRLANGMRVLAVERPSGGAVHARLFVRLGAAPPALAGMVARSLFGPCRPEDVGAPDPGLEALLAREEGLREEVRLAGLKARRGADQPPADLGEAYRGALEALRARLRPTETLDLVDALGASGREARAEADYLVQGVDLPVRSMTRWCELEASRLGAARLTSLPLQRAESTPAATSTLDPARTAFLAVAFPGHPYGQESAGAAEVLEGLGLAEARSFARTILQPEHLLLVLVGDVGLERLQPVLERSFGALAPEAGSPARDPAPTAAAPGARRLQVTLPGPPRLLMGWRLPPRSHPDSIGLRVLAKLLAGGPSARLRAIPMEERGVLASLTLKLGDPGGRDGGLLVVEASPGEGHSLGEAEQAITSEVLKLQQEPIQEEEAAGAQRLLALDFLVAQEDAARLAEALGEAWSQAGGWQAAWPDPARLKAWGAEELRRLARTYLARERSLVCFVEPDVLTSEDDPLDARLVEALRAMARRRVQDPAAVDALVRQSIRQLRMLPRSEREGALELLKPKGRP